MQEHINYYKANNIPILFDDFIDYKKGYVLANYDKYKIDERLQWLKQYHETAKLLRFRIAKSPPSSAKRNDLIQKQEYRPKSTTFSRNLSLSPSKKRFFGDATNNINTFGLARVTDDEIASMDDLVSDFQEFSLSALEELKKANGRVLVKDVDKLLAINCILKLTTTMEIDQDLFSFINLTKLN